MAKQLKDYVQKEIAQANMSLQVNKNLFDIVNSYRKKLGLTWGEFLEGLFQKLIDDEIKGKVK